MFLLKFDVFVTSYRVPLSHLSGNVRIVDTIQFGNVHVCICESLFAKRTLFLSKHIEIEDQFSNCILKELNCGIPNQARSV